MRPLFITEIVKNLSKKIYVGNMSFQTTEQQVNELFAQYGEVESIAMITDRDTGRFRGFSFVEMNSGADEAIAALDGTELDGRTLKVNEARPRQERGGNRGGNRGGGRSRFPDSGGRRW